jgi:hypothetical protein
LTDALSPRLFENVGQKNPARTPRGKIGIEAMDIAKSIVSRSELVMRSNRLAVQCQEMQANHVLPNQLACDHLMEAQQSLALKNSDPRAAMPPRLMKPKQLSEI